jgi:protein-S-isoprenylcysteine O-methyltransferase Ste14
MPGVAAAESQPRTTKRKRGAWRIFQTAVFIAGWLVAVFVPAGKLDWDRGWICTLVYVVCMTVLGLVVKLKNPGLIEARANWRHKDTKRFDKILLAVFFPLTLIQPAIAGLDTVRFRWSLLPFATVYAGTALFVLASALIGWALATNPYAESTVRIQTDRNHQVVSSGPYRYVRHPMYVGAIVLYPAAALIFGSVYALVVAGAIVIVFICRTAMEDRTLTRELPGYQEFASRTRFRLIPGLW